MWLMTRDGFYSIVNGPTPDTVTVRAREREALEAVFAGDGIKRTPGRDYVWRVTIDRHRFSVWLQAEASWVDYANFKDAVEKRQGRSRYVSFLHDVWWSGVRLLAGNQELPTLYDQTLLSKGAHLDATEYRE